MTVTSPPPSPRTPSRKRTSQRLSNFDSASLEGSSVDPYSSGTTNASTYSRRSSRTSQTSFQTRSPVTPRPQSSKLSRSAHERRLSRTSLSSNTSFDRLENDTAAGNLADELGQAWEEDEGEEGSSTFLEGLREGDVGLVSPGGATASPNEINELHDFGFGMVMQSPVGVPERCAERDHPHSLTVDPPTESRPGHQRHESAYDGSDYGPESDAEPADDFPPVLQKRLRDLEKLTRSFTNSEDAVSEGGGTVNRMIHGLKDLGAQGSIEYGVTRLITAYTSMATHRSHKTRDLFTQTHALMYGGTFNLPDEVIDPLLDDIHALNSAVPILRPQNPLLSLQILASQTEELSHSLRSVTDLLQESRLVSNAAGRKLKALRDMVEEMTVEQQLVENSIILIQAGDWDRRCQTRQAAKTCREVCEGFADRWNLSVEDTCASPNEAGRPQALGVMVAA